MGTRHAINLHRFVKEARVAAIYDLDQERARQVAGECGSARIFSDPLQLVQDAGVDAIVIASPIPPMLRLCMGAFADASRYYARNHWRPQLPKL